MKKTFIFGVILLVIGGVLFSIGLGNGGLKSVYWDDGFKVDARVSKSVNYQDVSEIDVNGNGMGPVVIQQGDTTETKVRLHASKSSHVSMTNHQGKLTITGSGSSGFIFGSQDFDSNQQPIVEVTVPAKTKLKSITLGSDSNTTVQNVSTKELNVNTSEDLTLSHVGVSGTIYVKDGVYGSINLNDVGAKSLDIDSGDNNILIENSRFDAQNSQLTTRDGDLTLRQNTWRNLTIQSSDANVDFDQQNILKTMQVRAEDGHINGQIEPSKHVGITANASDGHVTLYGKDTGNYGSMNAEKTYQLNADNGNIVISR
ncbi:DUF4097 domain-containing protein [Secundilactobacillus similis DSM 23365 = JCM 2765]|uniref:DUF4097 domain-containing protein n=1 Tax=Secundilactobacillus similis DSM 23365 = JCM 2765 TaxID=1423804 RepID=A0A0R2F192_9LACO|nr:DUF4097 family beta strand repeat-containing protein [Secundilactobacillus similis]KRN22386.1 hypothetical protein FD14_GL000802 [Secundilactobacillus similis DSM 23365 = JCM 2765]